MTIVVFIPTALGTMGVLWQDVPQCIRSTCVKLMLAFQISDNGNCGQKQSWVVPFSATFQPLFSVTLSKEKFHPATVHKCSKQVCFLKNKNCNQQHIKQQFVYRLYLIYLPANSSFSNNTLTLCGSRASVAHNKEQSLAQLRICLPKDQNLCSDKFFSLSV